MRTEYLVYFTESGIYEGKKFLGFLPPHYYLASSKEDRGRALLSGGVDVSDNDAHWRQWEREQNLNYMHG
jgi:hypothetical protein